MLRAARATVAIAALTVLVSLIAFLTGLESWVPALAFVPASVGGLGDVGGASFWLTPLTATLVHANFLHLGLNMLMLLWIGGQVERPLGAGGLVGTYVVGAYLAAAAQYAVDPDSLLPMIGASGAISALFGVYALMFGTVKRVTGSMRLNRAIHAAWLLAAWVAIQWMTALLAGEQGMMLATPAHIGGFVAGLLLQRPLLAWRYRRA